MPCSPDTNSAGDPVASVVDLLKQASEAGRFGLLDTLRGQTDAPADSGRELLDWAPSVDLDEGMARTEEWLRAEGLLDPGPP